MKIILNSTTKKQLEATKLALPHAILLEGSAGVGLLTIAKYIADKYTAQIIKPLTKKGDLDSLSGTISIDEIRKLYDTTKTRHEMPRFIIIDDADRMTMSAQAAILKLIEEPIINTHYILTTHSSSSLKLTVVSRLQRIYVNKISHKQTNTLLESLSPLSALKLSKLQFLANGLPAEIIRLAGNEEYFNKKVEIITDARTYVTGTTYESLKIAQKYHQDQTGAVLLIDSAITLVTHAAKTSPSHQIVNKLSLLLDIRKRILAGGTPRLQLTQLMVY